ncbi:MAG: hypothetical protein WA965_15835, partial [Mycobacterium sp.]
MRPAPGRADGGAVSRVGADDPDAGLGEPTGQQGGLLHQRAAQGCRSGQDGLCTGAEGLHDGHR